MFTPTSERIAALDWPDPPPVRGWRECAVPGRQIRHSLTHHHPAPGHRREVGALPGSAQPDPAFLHYEPAASALVDDDDDEPADPAVTMIPMAPLAAERAPRAASTPFQADGQNAAVLGANDLAALRTARIKDQLVTGDRVKHAGLRVFDLINRLLDDDADPAKAAEAQSALRRLTNVNPDKDTPGGPAEGGVGLSWRGVAIERRALGMDVKRTGAVNPVPDPASARRPAIALIKMMDTETRSSCAR